MNCKLSININKIALLRNQRLGNYPNPYAFAKVCEDLGADGITVHPRPDERHVRYSDLQPLKQQVMGEFNIEGYPSSDFLEKVSEIRPHQCTLVPDAANVLTSDSGWDVKANLSLLKRVIADLKDLGIRVSLFLDPDPSMVEHAVDTGADRIELYTGKYAQLYASDSDRAVNSHIETAEMADRYGIGLNAGHDLNLENLRYYVSRVPNLLEVSIGHAFTVDCLYMGVHAAIAAYKERLSKSK